jgi:hypothetical protein
MTQAIVTEKNNTVVINTQMPKTIVTGIMGPPGKSTINALEDVDVTSLNAGSILVYNAQTQKWISTTLMNQQIIDSGQY